MLYSVLKILLMGNLLELFWGMTLFIMVIKLRL